MREGYPDASHWGRRHKVPTRVYAMKLHDLRIKMKTFHLFQTFAPISRLFVGFNRISIDSGPFASHLSSVTVAHLMDGC